MATAPSGIRAVLLDFDGTLADSFAAITASTNHVRAAYGLPPLSEAEVRRHVGWGLQRLLQQLVPNAPLPEAIARYREHHDRILLEQTRWLPGVTTTLAELARRGYRLGVCSNKRVEFTRRLVQSLALGPAIGCILGPEDVAGRTKPDPAMLLEGMRRLGVSPQEALYVGDMSIDVETGRAAGVPVWIVRGGPESEEAIRQSQPQRLLNQFDELLEWLPPLSEQDRSVPSQPPLRTVQAQD
ncbi:MAG: HAD family hydrolase [Thermogemmata sp.]|uniref:phosphoglycolate phosphatase n=1 Tax=Thermogemmata fonticola TaxID=2755323 RepID=A0A7V8VCG4_9BACT|nr:HAD family hydrolase [Thermogemmata fonticola]MBA2225310.1 HAD family hydrolase [Thermogemmata fonticola]MCX8139621.1 HAD family hydrolase [Gemmataceae bacterium]